jgi:TatA/E family protein of Tat protein translocase
MLSSPFKDGVVVLLILLLFFGSSRLPALSRALGASVKEFKGGITDGVKDDESNHELTGTKTGERAGTGSESKIS